MINPDTVHPRAFRQVRAGGLREVPQRQPRTPSGGSRFALPSALIGLGAGIAIPYVAFWFNQRFDTSLESIGWLFAVQQLIMGLDTFLLPLITYRMGSFYTAVLIYTVRTILMNIVNPVWNSLMVEFFKGGVLHSDGIKQPLMDRYIWNRPVYREKTLRCFTHLAIPDNGGALCPLDGPLLGFFQGGDKRL